VSPIVTISGGGIIGNYISARLNKNNIEAIVIEKSEHISHIDENIRTLTLNSFSKKLIDNLGISVKFAEIKKINVFDGEGSGKIDFSSEEINEDNLSYVVFYNELQSQLQESVLNQTIFGNQIKELNDVREQNYCTVLLSNNEEIHTKIIAGCDGRNSKVAKLGLFNEIRGDYKQTALTFTAKANFDDMNSAYQIFSEKGIFAIMPLPETMSGATHTIVWSIDNKKLEGENAEDYINNNISYFENKLNTEIKIHSKILSFNLSNHYFKNYISGSSVLIGDAAHSIHPLAGQGINLGFADADAFCEEVIKAYEMSIEADRHLILKRYEIRRKNMNLLMLKSMDFFVNLFKSNNLYMKLLRNIGLSSVNKNQFLKRFFINHAAGKNSL
tara:strand:- start:1525 stop:2682 length:1158 start_codon:yes stop_codon:yes gene_type:complete